MLTRTSMKSLVNPETGMIDRRILTDPDIYKQELEQVFGRCWIVIGHESLISNPNDFHSGYIGEDPILMTRDAKGKTHAFLNMCRHRGNRVCRADYGNAPSFMCTYHGWTFATDGKLVGVPGYKEAYFEELDRSQWGLIEASCDSYKGIVFATWDKSAPSLVDYLGDAAWYLDLILDRRAGGTELLGGMQRHMMATNWKIPSDNIAGDSTHVPVTHGSMGMIGALGSRTRPTTLSANPTSVNVYAGNGHGFIGKYDGPPREVNEGMNIGGVVAEYYQQHAAEFKRRMGEARANQMGGPTNIFPSTAFLGTSIVRMRIPRSPLKTEEWTYCLVDKDAPREVKADQKRRLTFQSGASGIMESDDSNNWDQVSRSGTFWKAKEYPVNYQLGLGRDKRSEMMPGTLSPNLSETNQRGFYAFWAEMMDASSWSQVKLSPKTFSK